MSLQQRPNFLWPGNLNSPAGKIFWQELARGKMVALECQECGEVYFPPRPCCPVCLGSNLRGKELSRRGVLHSWTELYFARPEFDTPFLLGLVDLAEGVGRVVARIEEATPGEVYIGMPVVIEIAKVSDTFSLYYAVPAK